jgi:hypothetical protein
MEGIVVKPGPTSTFDNGRYQPGNIAPAFPPAQGTKVKSSR